MEETINLNPTDPYPWLGEMVSDAEESMAIFLSYTFKSQN